ncbi:MAG TPA: tRNA epoxyqueuosine(34) reductase QueG [Bacteroidales bacterium]|nr:tRNA epoxyqueuosine(34) reductase QueG [Bacteroidales bacterium]HPS74126.1 tRNA epoxyqueuosine(34) reductase QueG [Bacteroidales bacterium]
MIPEERSKTIRTLSEKAGFDYCGFAPASVLSAEIDPYRRWIEKKHWGSMEYLHRDYSRRLDPRQIMAESRTVIALLAGYFPERQIPREDNYILSRYAVGKDYHVRIKDMLDTMTGEMEKEFPGILCRSFVDSGVLMEKAWAQQCGLGWRGKNTLLINPEHGSWFFIGIILTDLETAWDNPGQDRCGACDRCLNACPTGALEAPHVLNPLKCIAYQTIESKEELPADLREKFNDRIYGCDLCQEVCPYNRKPLIKDNPDCAPSQDLMFLRKHDWDSLTPEQFKTLFHHTPVKRIGYEKLMRNIRFVSGK